jgi:hypothetical protein
MGIRGPQPQEGALRRTGWRPSPLPKWCKDLAAEILKRPEFEGASSREVLEVALKAFATDKELDDAGL